MISHIFSRWESTDISYSLTLISLLIMHLLHPYFSLNIILDYLLELVKLFNCKVIWNPLLILIYQDFDGLL